MLFIGCGYTQPKSFNDETQNIASLHLAKQMQLQNFQVDADGISLNWQDHNLDLHNCFDFQSIQYDIPLRKLKATWRRSPEEWAKEAALPGFALIFSDITFFRVKERETDYPFVDDNCLASVSFHSIEARDEFDSISLSSSATDDLTFFFQSEWGFKVNAATAELIPLTASHSR